jgi:predicted phage terminase large subunit-like protein
MPDDGSGHRRLPTAPEAAAELLLRADAEKNFHSFVAQAWPVVDPSEFVDSWHIKVICQHLEAVVRNDIKHLILNVPPRSSKTLIISVLFPAWVWIRDPAHRWLCASYAQNLSMEHNVLCRRLVESGWYQARFGDKFQLMAESNTKTRFDNNKMGYRMATSVDGIVTGIGASTIIADDVNAATDASKTVLEATNAWWDQAISTRLNNRSTGHKIIVQQRLNEQDLTGHVLSKKDSDYCHLMLPMEFEPDRRCTTIPLPGTNGKPWTDPRKKAGELLWPDRFTAEDVASIKKDLGSQYAIAGQLQQRPAPGEGGIIKKSWFQWWTLKETPKIIFILQSWDTALSASEMNAFSAATTWGVFKDDKGMYNLILLSAWRGRLEYPELRKTVQMMSRDYRDDNWEKPRVIDERVMQKAIYKPNMVLIEAKANGKSLIQDLSRGGILAHGFNPDKHGDKIERVKLITPLLEGGRVWVAAMPPAFSQLYPSADLLVSQAGMFPNAESRDMVDTMTQALLRLEASGWVSVPTDPQPVENDGLDQREAIY